MKNRHCMVFIKQNFTSKSYPFKSGTFPSKSSPFGSDTARGFACLPQGKISKLAPVEMLRMTYSRLIPRHSESPTQAMHLTTSGAGRSFTSPKSLFPETRAH